jgi:hypothetical protein
LRGSSPPATRWPTLPERGAAASALFLIASMARMIDLCH